jgi:hypothetical protein
MQNWLTNATKTRVLREIRKYLYNHPRYRADHLNVQNHYSFEERPQRGVVITGASADRVRLSADNYLGRLTSFLMQTTMGTNPGTSIEWVKENQKLLEQYAPNRSIFPSPPGVYVIKILSLPIEERNLPGLFTIDPYLTVQDEPVITFGTDHDMTGQLSHQDIYPNSARLWLNGKRPLLVNVDYTLDYTTGELVFLKPTPIGSTIFADYRYQIATQGPFQYKREASEEEAIPGAIIAFGDRLWVGDEIAIVATSDRSETAEIYGGKFEVNFDLNVFSRDAEDREKLSDYVVSQILESQNRLGFEGIELIDVTPNGESQEIYNESQDVYYYDATVSLSYRVDWQLYVPLPIEIFRVETTSKAQEEETGYLDGTYTSDLIDIEAHLIKMAGVRTVVGRDVGYERVR